MEIEKDLKRLERLFAGNFGNAAEYYQAARSHMTEIQSRRWRKRISGMTIKQIAEEENVSRNAVRKSVDDAIIGVKKKIENLNKKIR